MNYDFQSVIERRGTGCIKHDRRPDLDPFWVADMDFVSAPEILEALHRRVDHGVFGYAQPHAGLVDAVLAYLERRHGARVSESEIVHLGGLVPALSLACKAFARPGDSVLTCTPVYPPFLEVHKDAGLDLQTVPHIRDAQDKWTFDWEGLEKAVAPRTRIFLLCHPQNPLGRVFAPAEIERLAEFCRRHDLVLVSDEIHCDLVLEPEKTPFVSALRLPEEFHDRLVVLLAPSKTWNIAGLGYSFAVIPDDSLRRRFTAARGHSLPEINALAYYAAEAAYRHGEPWRQALLETLRENRSFLADFLAKHAPALRHTPGEATYLAWIDASALGKSNPAQFFEKSASLFLSDGAYFGQPDHVRFNFGCPRSRLAEGLEKMVASDFHASGR
jgi:cystathionine beta-lyase